MTIILDKDCYEGASDAEFLMSLWDAAAEGTPNDQYKLAEAYRLCKNISHSQEYAMKWYDTAISNGSGDAMYRLYTFLRQGKYGMARDMDKSMTMLKKSSEAGNISAMMDLTWEYLKGKYIPQDFASALTLARKTYDTLTDLPDNEYNDVIRDQTIWNLCCSLVAEGSFESIDEAHHRLYKIKRRDSYFEPAATALLGYIHETTRYNKFKNESCAAKEYGWIVRHSHSTQVACRLADMYFSGRGVEQSYGESLILYRFAAVGKPRYSAQGDRSFSFNDIASYKIGQICEKGITGLLKPDEEVAQYWYRISAYCGYEPAVEKLGYKPEKCPDVVYESSWDKINSDDIEKICRPTINYSLILNTIILP